MLMERGGGGVLPFVVVVCFDFFYLALAISFYFVQMVFFFKDAGTQLSFLISHPAPSSQTKDQTKRLSEFVSVKYLDFLS